MNQNDNQNKQKQRKKQQILLVVIVLICLNIIAAIWVMKSRQKVLHSESDTSKHIVANPQKLIGKWLRRDGGYMLEISNINNDGTFDATYYNPNPIHIAETKILQAQPALKIFVKLQDKGYPGSSYTLDYDPIHDICTGIYFHAGMNREFNVLFVRLRNEK